VFACEVNAPLGRRESLDEPDLARRVERERAALPGIEAPAMRHAAFKRGGEVRKNIARVFERRRDAFGLGHRFEGRRVRPDRIRSQRASRARVRARIGRQPLDRTIGVTWPLNPSFNQKRVRVCRNTFTVRE
jgi:hypothetical protein